MAYRKDVNDDYARSPLMALAAGRRGAVALHPISDGAAACGMAGADLSAAVHAHAARVGCAARPDAGALCRWRHRTAGHLARAGAVSVWAGGCGWRLFLRRRSVAGAPAERP